jgi:hypothetical protein
MEEGEDLVDLDHWKRFPKENSGFHETLEVETQRIPTILCPSRPIRPRRFQQLCECTSSI